MLFKIDMVLISQRPLFEKVLNIKLHKRNEYVQYNTKSDNLPVRKFKK
jgi:hypothetical protein